MSEKRERRQRRQRVKVNNKSSLESLMQETYNDACNQIVEAQQTINVMANGSDPEDVDDITKIAKEKTNALKVKDSAIKIKLELAKLQADIIKNQGNVDETLSERQNGEVSMDDFSSIRAMIKKGHKATNDGDEDEE